MNTSKFSQLILCLAICISLITESQGAIFSIIQSGARGDGATDDSQAILRAWSSACAAPQPSKVMIPKGTYMVTAVTFQGPCKAPITFESQGTWKAPPDAAKQKSQDGWIVFQNIDGLTMTGGVYDGQGALAWTQNNCAKTGKCSSLPMNFRFNAVTNSLIQGISSLNSKLFHMNLINCKNINFVKVTIDAPENSLNTDGIHIGRSTGINITDSNIKTGDDCVSLGDGSEQVTVLKVTCGPGHGISVGSLGKYQNESPVQGVFVRNCTFTNTMNGVRVKTWPASPNGVARDLHFEDLIMNNVGTPVLIDQEYCPYQNCQLQNPSRVKISDVTFKGIRGTTSTQLAVKLVCSKGLPCENVVVSDINLVYNGKEGPATSQCSNVKPAVSGKLFPPACGKSA